jgi:hypothetical protein
MRTAKSVSVETLDRLWSELVLLRREVERAEHAQSTKLDRLTSAIVATKDQLPSRSNRDSRSSCRSTSVMGRGLLGRELSQG